MIHRIITAILWIVFITVALFGCLMVHSYRQQFGH
jgi:hypothetical protein